MTTCSLEKLTSALELTFGTHIFIGGMIQPGGGKVGASLAEAEEQLAERTNFLQKQQLELLKQEKQLQEKQLAREEGAAEDEGREFFRKVKDPQQVKVLSCS